MDLIPLLLEHGSYAFLTLALFISGSYLYFNTYCTVCEHGFIFLESAERSARTHVQSGLALCCSTLNLCQHNLSQCYLTN